MQYVQNLPPIVKPVPDAGDVKPTERVAAAHPVQERTLPPMIYRQHEEAPAEPAIRLRLAPRQATAGNDRRKVCRRVRNEPVLDELRAGTDRRHRNQRKSDLTTAIDETI